MIPTGLYSDVVTAESTRKKILEAAFREFYRNGFQGGGLNQIVEAAGTTKGALFHHFAGKQELGYAVVDDVIGPILQQRWLEPLTGSKNPIADLKRAFRRYVREDIESGSYVLGCPLNNMAQEMSPLDAGFRQRTDALYNTWRACYGAAFAGGIRSGTVKKGASPRNVAALAVAAQMGIWGTGKSSQSEELMTQAAEAFCEYLDSLKA